jgi:hypothetical protein
MLRIETESENEMVMRGPESFFVHEIFGNAIPARREIRIDETHLHQRVRLASRDVDDIGERLPGARFGGELVEYSGGIGAVVFRLDERIALVKLVEQRLELIDRSKTIDDDPAFFSRAFAEFLFPVLTF